MTSRADFIAGNTRLRARLPGLLGPSEYGELAGGPREAAIERLRTSIYRPYLDRDQPGDGLLLVAVGRRLRDLLHGLRGLYGGTAGAVVAVLLARHDLHDALTLLRGARTAWPCPDRLDAIMGVGALDQRAAADIAAADGATAALRLAAHGLPDPATARTLPAAWKRYELSADPDELEATVAWTAIAGWTARLQQAGRAARPVLDLVRAETDRANLLAVLGAPAADPPRLLPSGLVPAPALTAAGRGDPTPLLAARPGWRAALTRHSRDGDLAALEWDLQLTLWRGAVRGLRRGDPLGADVPVGYVIATECEARTVRLLLSGEAATRDVRGLLVG